MIIISQPTCTACVKSVMILIISGMIEIFRQLCHLLEESNSPSSVFCDRRVIHVHDEYGAVLVQMHDGILR